MENVKYFFSKEALSWALEQLHETTDQAAYIILYELLFLSQSGVSFREEEKVTYHKIVDELNKVAEDFLYIRTTGDKYWIPKLSSTDPSGFWKSPPSTYVSGAIRQKATRRIMPTSRRGFKTCNYRESDKEEFYFYFKSTNEILKIINGKLNREISWAIIIYWLRAEEFDIPHHTNILNQFCLRTRLQEQEVKEIFELDHFLSKEMFSTYKISDMGLENLLMTLFSGQKIAENVQPFLDTQITPVKKTSQAIKPKKDTVVIFGNSDEFFNELDDFYDYLESLVNGTWLENHRRIYVNELLYLRATTIERCLDATILLMAYKSKIIAEIHVKPAKVFDPPVQDEDGKTKYSVGFPIRYDTNGPLIFLFKEPLHKSDVPIEKGFPKSYRGGAYVELEALKFIRSKGKIVRHPLIEQKTIKHIKERKTVDLEKVAQRELDYDFKFLSKNESSLAQEKLIEIFNQDLIRKVHRALNKKRQIVLVGPPGTSKTYFAKLFAQAYSKAYQLVQFHPSYEYSDFVEGFVPHSTGGTLSFELKEKIFLKACKLAENQVDETSKIIILTDEINRGNLGKILGELISSLEDRDHPIILSSGKKIVIPKNLYLIGTMNSADRSVGIIDKALRRRFQFIEFPPEKSILEKALTSQNLEGEDKIIPEKVMEIFIKINKIIKNYGRDKNLLIGHTMFIHETWEELNDELEMNILPYIEENFYGNQEILQKIHDVLHSEFSEFLPIFDKIGEDME